MVQEWLKFRYGVFEEHGYADDDLYPHNYLESENNTTLPTSCIDFEATTGEWVTK